MIPIFKFQDRNATTPNEWSLFVNRQEIGIQEFSASSSSYEGKNTLTLNLRQGI